MGEAIPKAGSVRTLHNKDSISAFASFYLAAFAALPTRSSSLRETSALRSKRAGRYCDGSREVKRALLSGFAEM